MRSNSNPSHLKDFEKAEKGDSKKMVADALVPSTFAEMAHFNASVMGLGNPPWLSEIVPLPTLRGEIGLFSTWSLGARIRKALLRPEKNSAEVNSMDALVLNIGDLASHCCS